jgi:hypothetical protein
MKYARKYGHLLSYVPTVKLVATTGALAMNSAREDSDIDFMIISKKDTLWSTRIIVWTLLKLINVPLRKPLNKKEKDKLCLNVWIDEADLIWPTMKRNIYTAHEILQVVPLVNKDSTYERFINKNRWVGEYWPNAFGDTKTLRYQDTMKRNIFYLLIQLLIKSVTYVTEPFAYKFQRLYMKPKITIETVTKTRALFHPNDLTKHILGELRRYCKT